MKLRNKKTGKIYTARSMWFNESIDDLVKTHWKTLKEFCEDWEDWEDFTPTEPLIKDPKIRKAVRAWADANEYAIVKVSNDMVSEPNCGNVQIHFENTNIIDEDKYGVHTISELCGENEE
jgi:hypothetical protein